MSYKNETGHFQTPLKAAGGGGSNEGELKLFYQRWIPSNPKQGCDVVIHHGLGEHSDRYGNILGMLEGTGITVYAYDARGHGRSEGKKGLAEGVGQLSDDLGVFLEFIQKEYGVSKPLLYGHSMGGAVVLNFVGKSKTNQDKVKAVVSTGPALGVEKNCYQAFMSSLLSCLRHVIPSVTLPSGLATNRLTRDVNVIEAYKSDPMNHDLISISLAFSLLESGKADIIPSARAMTLPIFLGHGETDVLTYPKATQEYFENCASTQKTLKIYPGLDHEIHNELKEDKEKVLADIKAFVISQM